MLGTHTNQMIFKEVTDNESMDNGSIHTEDISDLLADDVPEDMPPVTSVNYDEQHGTQFSSPSSPTNSLPYEDDDTYQAIVSPWSDNSLDDEYYQPIVSPVTPCSERSLSPYYPINSPLTFHSTPVPYQNSTPFPEVSTDTTRWDVNAEDWELAFWPENTTLNDIERNTFHLDE